MDILQESYHNQFLNSHTHNILVTLMSQKFCKICICIALQLHISMRGEGKSFSLCFNQLTSDTIYCHIITTNLIVGEHGTLDNCKVGIRPGVAGSIHQHYHKRIILPRSFILLCKFTHIYSFKLHPWNKLNNTSDATYIYF